MDDCHLHGKKLLSQWNAEKYGDTEIATEVELQKQIENRDLKENKLKKENRSQMRAKCIQYLNIHLIWPLLLLSY